MQRVNSIEWKSNGKVIVIMDKQSASKTAAGFCNKKIKEESDLIPHPDLIRARDRMTAHLLVAYELADPSYNVGDRHFPMDAEWFAAHHYADDPRFKDVVITKIEAKGKDAADKLVISGYKLTSNGDQAPLKTPEIDLYDTETSNDYFLRDILLQQWETLSIEAIEYRNELKFVDSGQMDLFTAPGTNLKIVPEFRDPIEEQDEHREAVGL